MSVSAALEALLAKADISEIEAEIARSLAGALDSKDNGQGKASTAKELRSLLAEIEDRLAEQKTDSLDELAKKRATRRTS